jgi:hypothetical protein
LYSSAHVWQFFLAAQKAGGGNGFNDFNEQPVNALPQRVALCFRQRLVLRNTAAANASNNAIQSYIGLLRHGNEYGLSEQLRMLQT